MYEIANLTKKFQKFYENQLHFDYSMFQLNVFLMYMYHIQFLSSSFQTIFSSDVCGILWVSESAKIC